MSMSTTSPRPPAPAAAEPAPQDVWPTPPARTGQRLYVLKEGDTFVVADACGDITGEGDGLFHNDTRVLSTFRLLTSGHHPALLSSAVTQDNAFFTANLTNRPLLPLGESSMPQGVLHIERRRFLWDRRMFERVRIANHGVEDVLLPMSIEHGADFADIFEVRGTHRARRGEIAPPTTDGRRAHFRYQGLDGVERTSCIAFSEPPARMSGSRAEFMFSLPRGKVMDLHIECGADRCEAPSEDRWRLHAVQARLSMRVKRRRGASLRLNHPTPIEGWCGRRELNPHGRSHQNLNLACLPVPPRPLLRSPVRLRPGGL